MNHDRQSASDNHPVIGAVSCITIDGGDARAFSQAQFSADVDRLSPGHWQWNAWLDPQGRVWALMHLADAGDGRLLAVLRGGDAETIRAGLQRYVLRARVTLGIATFSGRAGPARPMGGVEQERGRIAVGYGDRSLELESGPAPSPADDSPAVHAWRLAEIRAGWPTLSAGAASFLPPALGLEHLGAVAFDKGGHKRRLVLIRSAEPLRAGDTMQGDGPVSAQVLAATEGPMGFEALVVVDDKFPYNNELSNKIEVIQRFEP